MLPFLFLCFLSFVNAQKSDTTDACIKIAANQGCAALPVSCLECSYNYQCVYGQNINVSCRPIQNLKCDQDPEGNNFAREREMNCRYCYQTDPKFHICQSNSTCQVVSSPRDHYVAMCTVPQNILCLGRRTFYKKRPCNYTQGYSWSTALILSVLFGGFGADRFYLGMWQEGIGKLFSFGGLGVWTLVDVVLIATGYLGPSDGSLYMP